MFVCLLFCLGVEGCLRCLGCLFVQLNLVVLSLHVLHCSEENRFEENAEEIVEVVVEVEDIVEVEVVVTIMTHVLLERYSNCLVEKTKNDDDWIEKKEGSRCFVRDDSQKRLVQVNEDSTN